jgi:UDP-glucose 4-epimerase
MKSKSKILIIGGTGFLGFHLAKYLIKKKYNITSFSLNKPVKHRLIKKVKYLLCDISKKNLLKKNIDKYYDYVINCGGYVNHYNKVQNYKTHYTGVKNLFSVFKNKKIKKFIQIGSSLEYGKTTPPNSEGDRCVPKMSYGQCKLKATKFLLRQNKKYKFPSVILRFYQLYGPHQDKNRFIPFIISSCMQGDIFPCSHGKQKRDFLYITDAVDGVYKAITNQYSVGKIINLGFGKPVMLKTIIEKIKFKIKKGKPDYGKIKMRKEEQLINYPNITLAKKQLKWKPKTLMLKGLDKTIKYFKANNKLNNYQKGL